MANKIGRNNPCPCGSGKKYKKCCGNLILGTPPPLKQQSLSNPSFQKKKSLDRHKANELIRQQQQGLGRPIVAAKINNQQVVVVGKTVHSSPEWETVPDFLGDYIKKTLGAEWGNAEIEKPFESRHPILQWYEKVCMYQQKTLDGSGKPQAVFATGALNCYLGLAYSLYLLEHNIELQQRYIERLKDINNFQGAYYELIVANCLIRSGFELELEDEADEQVKHCEFSAVSKKTGKKYWVEAKARGVSGILGKTANNGTSQKDPTGMLARHLKNAFQKPATDERLIFVDVNTSFENSAEPTWVERARQKLDQKEKDLKTGQAAYVFVTNLGFHWNLDSIERGPCILPHGLGIPDFEKREFVRLRDIYRRKQRHIDAYHIIEAVRAYPKIPITFDGSLPSEIFNENPQHLKIGEKYFFEDIGENGRIGQVTSATVCEQTKELCAVIDQHLVITRPMSDDELADYKSHPEAFFGTIKRHGKRTNTDYELFEEMVEIHMSYPKDSTLKKLKGCDNFEELKKLSHEDLVLEYCERMVGGFKAEKQRQASSKGG